MHKCQLGTKKTPMKGGSSRAHGCSGEEKGGSRRKEKKESLGGIIRNPRNSFSTIWRGFLMGLVCGKERTCGREDEREKSQESQNYIGEKEASYE